MMITKPTKCTKCGKEVVSNYGYRFCSQCNRIFYACCDQHSSCPSCGRMINNNMSSEIIY